MNGKYFATQKAQLSVIAAKEVLEESKAWSWDWSKDADAIIEKFGYAGLSQICAYTDMAYETDKKDGKYPAVKDAYFGPFGKLVGDSLTVFWSGVTASMRAVMGARNKPDLTEAARKKAYNKLAKYYKKFDKEPPPFDKQKAKASRFNMPFFFSQGEKGQSPSQIDLPRTICIEQFDSDP